jgi:tRNA threonylcarbamoyladenosine modification (KEOPS) complex Cgi121 subunit
MARTFYQRPIFRKDTSKCSTKWTSPSDCAGRKLLADELLAKRVSKSNSRPTQADYWTREIGPSSETICFATAFKLKEKSDLTEYARSLPQGIIVSDSDIVAGLDHIEAVLLQTHQYWKRNLKIARNGSIEILMRLSCKKQIADAVLASAIKNTDSVALLGFAKDGIELERLIDDFRSTWNPVKQDIGLLNLSREKAALLKKFHGLPASMSKKRLQVALEEMSVLLIFSK